MFGLGIAKGMLVTLRHLFRRPFTIQYPEERQQLPPRFRGFEFAWDVNHCTGCATCAKACPHGVIKIVTTPKPNGMYHVEEFTIDTAYCMFCALCVEACPYDALHMGGHFERATYRWDSIQITKDQLVAQWYQRQMEDPEQLPSGYLRPRFERLRKEGKALAASGEYRTWRR